MKKAKPTLLAAKRKLIQYYHFTKTDFIGTELICKDCVGISARDILEDIQMK